jgi:hypothetical protein
MSPMDLRRALRPNPFRLLLPLALLTSVYTAYAQVPAPQNDDGPLQTNPDVARVHLIDNDAILRMAKAGLGDDVLIQTIQLQPGHYDTTPDDLISLKSAGLSDRVIAAMQAHGTGLAIRNPAKSAAPPAALAQGVDEIGVYYRLPGHGKDAAPSGEWTELKTERVTFESGGAAKSILTHGIIAKDMNGHLNGPKSTLVLPTGVEILVYAPTGTDAEEYEFVRFRQHSDNREFRTLTGGVFHSHTGSDRDEIEFHPQKIAPQMYTFTVPIDIEKGEYGILPPGSSNIQGIAGTGKIFTFSIVE